MRKPFLSLTALFVFALCPAAAAQNLEVGEAQADDGPYHVLKLDGREVYRTNEVSALSIHTTFHVLGVALIEETGGSACPAQYRLFNLQTAKLTEEFGSCSDLPQITQQNEKLTFTFPGYYHHMAAREPGFKPPPPATWVYQKGVIRQVKTTPSRRGRG